MVILRTSTRTTKQSEYSTLTTTSVSHNISDCCAIKALKNPSSALLEEFLVCCRSPEDLLPNRLFCTDHLPLLSSIARDAMWLPVTSVDVERSFSQ